MAIVRTDLEIYGSAIMNDTVSNGGRMTAGLLASAVVGNVFPSASQAERTAGSQKFRKVFFKNSEVTTPIGLGLQNGILFTENYTLGADDLVFWLGTQSDVQSAYVPLDVNDKPINTPSARFYGGGQLGSDIGAGATVLTVAVHVPDAANFPLFAVGDSIRIADRTDVDDTGNNEVFATIAAGGVSGPTAGLYTLTVDSPIGPAFTAATTRVSSVLSLGTVQGTADTYVVTTGVSGTFNDAGSPLELDNEGTIEEGWTFTFSDATNFACTGTITGAVGSGTIGADFAPSNADFGKPYFTLRAAGWGGTYQAGDTLTVDTHPASVGIWLFRDIPAGTASLAGNTSILVIEGESP
jgi:hypothetical protein